MNRSDEEEDAPSPGTSLDNEKECNVARLSLNFHEHLKPSADKVPTKNIAPAMSTSKRKAARKRKWRKPKDMPKRPLSAYNIFFHHERKNIASKIASRANPESDTPSSMGFAGLAQAVAAKWRTLGPESRAFFEEEAAKEQLRYRLEVDEWTRRKNQKESDCEIKSSSFESTSYSEFAHRHSTVQQPRTVHHDDGSMFPFEGSLVSSLWPSLSPSRASVEDIPEASTNSPAAHESAAVKTDLDQKPAAVSSRKPSRENNNNAELTSLHQLASELDEDELNFLSSLR